MTEAPPGPWALLRALCSPELRLPAPDRLLLAALLAHSREGRCSPGVARLAGCCSLSERRVRVGLRNLQAAGLLAVAARQGRASAYTIHLEVLGLWARRWKGTPARGAGARSAEKAAATELTEEMERGAFEAPREEGPSAACNRGALPTVTDPTPARCAAPPAQDAGDSCRFASPTPARGAPKQAIERDSKQAGGEGCGEGGQTPEPLPSETDLEGLPGRFPPEYRTAAAMAVGAYRKRGGSPLLLRDLVARLADEAGMAEAPMLGEGAR